MFMFRRSFSRGNRLHTIAEAAHPGSNLVEIPCSIMADSHGACRDRDRNILNTANTPHGGIDLGRTGCTIHTVNAKANLVQCFTHDLLF